MLSGSRPAAAASWCMMSISSARDTPSRGPGQKPSPSRPARRAAALEWPPITMGTRPLAGLGFTLTPENEAWSLSNDVLSASHSARMAPM